jgi:hypothetical protein
VRGGFEDRKTQKGDIVNDFLGELAQNRTVKVIW